MDRPNTSQIDLSALYVAPSALAQAKQIDHLDKYCRRYIELSPFLCLGTSDAEGRMDVTPRGDPPGFVKVLDDRTLAIPDRPGNNRIDALKNLTDHPRIGLLFLIPGIDETLRVNGSARLSTEPALLQSMAVDGKVPKLAIVVQVEEAFLHCAKAFRRSKLWDPAQQQPKGTLPSLGRMIVEQTKTAAISVEDADARIEKGYRESMY